MKYIFLITLFICAIHTDAAKGTQPSGFGGGSGIDPESFITGTDSGTIGGGQNTDSGSIGGQNTDSGTTEGPGGYDSGFIGGGNGGSGGGGGFQPSAGIGKPAPTLGGFMVWFIEIINYLIRILFAVSVLFFLYGVFTLMFVHGTNEESRSKGKKFMLWGIISLFVMISVWGLVTLLNNSLFGNGPLVGPTFNI